MTLLSRKYIDDNDVVARYLADRLSEEERESFETYFLQHRELLQELNRTAQFKSGLMDLRERGELAKLVIHQPRWKRAISAAIAASITLAAIGAILWFDRQGASHILAASITTLDAGLTSTVSLTDSYEIQRTRTSSYDATITRPSRDSAIKLRIRPEALATSARYRVSLRFAPEGGAAVELGTTNNLQPAGDGFVVVYLNASTISPGVYELEISGDAKNDTANSVSTFLIAFIDKPKAEQ